MPEQKPKQKREKKVRKNKERRKWFSKKLKKN